MEKNLFASSKELKILNCSTQTIKGCFLQIFKTVTEDREQRERESSMLKELIPLTQRTHYIERKRQKYVDRADNNDMRNTETTSVL